MNKGKYVLGISKYRDKAKISVKVVEQLKTSKEYFFLVQSRRKKIRM